MVQQNEAIWLGASSTLLDALWSDVTVYHVQNVRGVQRALQHGLAACLVLDVDLPDPEIEDLLVFIQHDLPHVGILALMDAPLADEDASAYTAINRFVSREVEPARLLAILREVTSQAEWDLTSNDYPALRDRARQLEGLLQGTLAMAQPSDDVLGNLREVARVAMDADGLVVLMANEDYTNLSDMLNLGVPGRYLTICRQHFRSLPDAERMMYLGDEVLLRAREPDTPAHSTREREADALGAWSYMRFPIAAEQRLIGFVSLYSEKPGRFNGAHLQLGRLFAAQIATAVQNWRFFLRLNRAEQYQRAVSDVARLLAENLELDEVLNYIVKEAVQLVDGSAGNVSLVQPDRSLTVGATYGESVHWVAQRVAAGVGQSGMIALTGRASVVKDYANWGQANPELQASFPPNTLLFGVPLSYRNLVLGVLQVTRSQNVPGDPDEALDALMLLAPSAATAIAKAQLHETIQQERRQLQAVLDHTPAAVVTCDARGRIQLINPAAARIARLLGFEPKKLADRSIHDLAGQLMPVDAERLTEVPRAIEVMLGDLGEYVVQIAPITRPNGAVDGYVSVAQDVTEMRKVDRMKSNLNQILTHDLGNMVMLAQNPLALMDEPDLMPDQREQLKNMLTASLERMGALIHDVMELDMVPSLDGDSVAPYRLEVLAQQAIESNQVEAAKKQITLDYVEDDLPPDLEGHKVLIKQAIENLVSNAIKYTPAGGHVTVRVDRAAGDAVLHVIDNGFGIPENKLDSIFQPGVRIKNARTRFIPGTGLGLNLVKTFVEVHGGHVTVASVEDEGSTFSIYLPVERVLPHQPASSPIVRIDLSAQIAEREE
ncbi:MAG: GAF domain-containing protein [Anaerolineae bacterium]|nr:GAF domain-containing protein [Anaerolineae bacterium]